MRAEEELLFEELDVIKTVTDPAEILLKRIGREKEKMEDQRTRRTYWLSKIEINMIDELAKMTGMDKYEVVCVAVQSMYSRATNRSGTNEHEGLF